MFLLFRLRELKADWYHIPMQSVKCTIDDIDLPESKSEIQRLGEDLSNTLMNKEFSAVIKVSCSCTNKKKLSLFVGSKYPKGPSHRLVIRRSIILDVLQKFHVLRKMHEFFHSFKSIIRIIFTAYNAIDDCNFFISWKFFFIEHYFITSSKVGN